MTIEINHAVRKPLSRAAFCLLTLLPMGAVMAASKPTTQTNPFMRNPSQAGQTGAYTTQIGVVAQGSSVIPAVQGPTTTSSASAKTPTTNSKKALSAGGGGLQ
jgi:hypothetical protein